MLAMHGAICQPTAMDGEKAMAKDQGSVLSARERTLEVSFSGR
jgi:hypothetical protein